MESTRSIRHSVRRFVRRDGAALSPLTITLLYLIVSIGWILFSDEIVALLADAEAARRLQSIKGIGFVSVTASMIFVLISRYRRMLVAETEARAAERQQRERLRRVVASVRPSTTPRATAQRICRSLAVLPGIAEVTYLAVRDGQLVVVASAPRTGRTWRPGRSLSREVAREVTERATHGPWLEQAGPTDGGPLSRVLARSGLRDAIVAPIRHDRGSLVGVLIATARAPASAAPHLEPVVEVGRMAGAWLAPLALAERARERRRATIRHAAANLTVVFQPIVTLSDGRPVGHEALARFADGMAPAERFAEAGELGMALELEDAAIRAAIGIARRSNLPADGWLGLNVSAQMLLDGPRLTAALAGCERPVVLELTEQQRITDYAAIRECIGRLEPPVRLALDDIGEAFSGLRHLVELGPTFAKLDLALVRDIDTDPVRQALVAGLRHYALQTGTELIAEGIQTEAERRALVDLGVGLGQGFLFGRPMPGDQLARRDRAAAMTRVPRAEAHRTAD